MNQVKVLFVYTNTWLKRENINEIGLRVGNVWEISFRRLPLTRDVWRRDFIIQFLSKTTFHLHSCEVLISKEFRELFKTSHESLYRHVVHLVEHE